MPPPFPTSQLKFTNPARPIPPLFSGPSNQVITGPKKGVEADLKPFVPTKSGLRIQSPFENK